MGQPAVRLARPAAPAIPLVGAARASAPWSCSISPGSTTSAALSPTGRFRRAPATRSAARGAGAPAGRCSTPSSASSGPICRSWPRISESSPRPSSGCGTRLGCPGCSCSSSGSIPTIPTSPHRLANHVEHRVVYTGTHDYDTARGWLESLPAERRAFVDAELGAARICRAAAVVGPDPDGPLLAGGARDGAGPGRARAGQRGADERSRAAPAAAGAGRWSAAR